MKKILLTALFSTAITFVSSAGVLVLEGKYQNKNLYVQNGYTGTGVGFCTMEVSINGQLSTDEIQSTAFEIDFSQFEIKPGTKVIVEIRNKDDCQPKILNPEALKAKATFETVSIALDETGVLKWKTTGETGSLPFIIEQKRWNKWIKVGEVDGLGTSAENSYSFIVSPHSGTNIFRIKQIGFGGGTRYSKEIVFNNTSTEKVQLNQDKKSVSFSSETMYEVYDMYGNIVKKGYGSSLSMENMAKGSYFICYDNEMQEIKK